MNNWIIAAAFLSYALPLGTTVGLVLLWRKLIDRENRRSPISMRYVHLPGEQLRKRLTAQDEKFWEVAGTVSMIGPLFALVWLGTRLRNIDWAGIKFGLGDAIFLLSLVAVVAWSSVQLIKHGKLRRRYRQGLAAEIATAQLLVPLQADGCQIFHDLPAEGFNIDHVVVAPHAVFAVETKSRMKPATGGRESARVRYDGKVLQFPDHFETKPLDQARAQARWLAAQLTGATGEPVKVVPAVSLPGWYVELTREGSRAEVVVFNPKSAKFMTSSSFGQAINQGQQLRIAYALTRMYPEPS